MKDVTAFDLSLTSTGYANGSGVGTIVPAPTLRGTDRLRWIRRQVLDRARGLVVLEGYAYAARGRAIVSLGELGGVVRVALSDAGIRYVEVPPNVRAKFATGRGNAPKEQVLVEAVKRLGYTGHSNDEADALWLRALALAHYGMPGAPSLPAAHTAAIASVEWPDVVMRAA